MHSPLARRWRPRLDHAFLVAGAVVLTIGSLMPWVRGQTKFLGYVDWTGLSETAEGAMLIACGLIAVAFVRWRSTLEEIAPRTRLLPAGVAAAAAGIWVIVLQRILTLRYDVPRGAQPQVGLFVAGFGVVILIAGAFLAARTWADPAWPPPLRVPRRPGGPLVPRVGADGYATGGRVERRDEPPDG